MKGKTAKDDHQKSLTAKEFPVQIQMFKKVPIFQKNQLKIYNFLCHKVSKTN